MNMSPIISSRLEQLLGFLKQDPDNVNLQIEAFEVALHSGDFVSAETVLSQAKERIPNDPGWRNREALLLLAKDEFGTAEEVLAGLIQEGHSDPGLLYNWAYARFRSGDWEGAKETITSLLEGPEPVAALAWTLWLRCEHHLTHLDEGLNAFTEAVKKHAVPAEAWGIASLMAFDAERLQDARLWAERAVSEDSTQMEALVTCGSLALGRQDSQTAENCFRKALARNGQDGRSWSGMAFTRMLQLDLLGAKDAFAKAVAFMPDHVGTWIGYGWCLLFMNQAEAAKSAFERAVNLDRNFGESHAGLAASLIHLGERQQAETEATIALKLNPHGLSAQFVQILLKGRHKNQEDFLRAYQTILGNHTIEDDRGAKLNLSDVVMRRPRSR